MISDGNAVRFVTVYFVYIGMLAMRLCLTYNSSVNLTERVRTWSTSVVIAGTTATVATMEIVVTTAAVHPQAAAL